MVNLPLSWTSAVHLWVVGSSPARGAKQTLALQIRPDAKAALDRVAEIIRSKSQGAVRIEGFTDSSGAADYNLRLSNARAVSVKNWLIERERLGSAEFATQGFGATRFVAPNAKPDGIDDPAGRQKNRRVEIIIQKQN
jgi:outer membrane protein OmpA-like peptidoglycan-associated protein